jgi:hypothetical protein
MVVPELIDLTAHDGRDQDQPCRMSTSNRDKVADGGERRFIILGVDPKTKN